jgi:uncharacterized cupin superfamily protein
LTQSSQVFKWGQPRLNLSDRQKRFLRSEWNYFLIDQEAGILAGYWYAEQGQEILGDDDFVEIIHVIEGSLNIQSEDSENTAGPGDTAIIRENVMTKLVVENSIRAFFICYSVNDPKGYADAIMKINQHIFS